MFSGYHATYINKNVLIEYLKNYDVEEVSTKQKSLLQRDINRLIQEGVIDENDFNSTLTSWMKQGKERVLIRKFNDGALNDLKDADTVENLFNKLELSDDIRSTLGYSTTSDKHTHLYDIDIQKSIDEVVTEINLSVACIVKAKKQSDGTSEYLDTILPVFICLDVSNSEIVVRVQIRDSLRFMTDVPTTDIGVASLLLNEIARDLNIDIIASADEQLKMKKTLTELHKDIVKLPEEVLQKVKDVDGIVESFVKDVFVGLEYVDNISEINTTDLLDHVIDIKSKIGNVLLYSLTKNFDDETKDSITTSGYGNAPSFHATGCSESKIKQTSAERVPVQISSDFYSVGSALVDKKTKKAYIDREGIDWFSVCGKENVRTTITCKNGFIRVDFSRYTYEEDIQNVLSKISEFHRRENE